MEYFPSNNIFIQAVSPHDLSVAPFASHMTDKETHFPDKYRPLVTKQPITATNSLIDHTDNQWDDSESSIGPRASQLFGAE